MKLKSRCERNTELQIKRPNKTKEKQDSHNFRASNLKPNINSDETGQKANKQTSLKRTKLSTHTRWRAYVPFFDHVICTKRGTVGRAARDDKLSLTSRPLKK